MSRLVLAVLALLALPSTALAHYVAEQPPSARIAQAGGVDAACPGVPIRADRVITGSFGVEQMGSYVMVPFDVPAGTTSVRVKYCWDKPDAPKNALLKHTLDLGLWSARPAGGQWGEEQFRGWGGSSHPDVTVTPQGFSTEAQYEAEPKGVVPGRTTRGFVPGPIQAGQWAAEIGVAAVVSQADGDADGRVAWRVEVQLDKDPAFAASPYEPAPYDETPVRRSAGWYAGDLHVHAEHSALGDAPTSEVLSYAFSEPPRGPGLDFVTVTDYVTTSNWGELGRYQKQHPGKLIGRSAEIITYRGHTQNQLSLHYVDHRLGPVVELLPDGSLAPVRAARAPSSVFDEIHRFGGFTQVNHPTIFPSDVPGLANVCRGCPWDYSDIETDWTKVDAYEVHTGPTGEPKAPNGFTLIAITEFDSLWQQGFRPAAIAVSDSHHAGKPENALTQTPVGIGTTVVYAKTLSERGVRDAVRAGRTYAKVFGPKSADLRLSLQKGRRSAIMGGRLKAAKARLKARVFGGSRIARTVQLRRDGRLVKRWTMVPRRRSLNVSLVVRRKGNYRLQVMRGKAVEGVTTPVTLG